MISQESTSELIAKLIGAIVVTLLIDAFAAWVLMHGIQGLHVKSGFWPCFWIICAVSVAARSGSGSK